MIRDPRHMRGFWDSPGLSKHKSVFRVPCAHLFLCSSHIFHSLVQDRDLCLKCYQGIQSPSSKFITTLKIKPDLATYLENLSFSF